MLTLSAPRLEGAACFDRDPELWFSSETAAEAKAICAGCPARAGCLQWALSNGEDWGIWGALDERERVNLQRRRKRQASA